MISLNYKIRGEGLPIILLHGFCETGEIWNSFVKNISDEFQVITIDLPGFGQSKLNSPAFTLDELGADINKWVVNMSFQNAILIGHSLGGYISLAMLAQNPELFSGLGLMHSTARADDEAKQVNRLKVIEFVKSNGVKAFIDSFVPGLYHIKDHPSIKYAHKIALMTSESTFSAYTFAMKGRPSREHLLASTPVPILIIAGQNDPVIEINSLEEQAVLNSKISFYKLSEVGHMGMFEAESKVSEIVNDFAKDVKSRIPA